MKMPEAKISCSPCVPWMGNTGESAQMSNGTLAMRLIVMELGRFTNAPAQVLSRLSHQSLNCILPQANPLWCAAGKSETALRALRFTLALFSQGTILTFFPQLPISFPGTPGLNLMPTFASPFRRIAALLCFAPCLRAQQFAQPMLIPTGSQPSAIAAVPLFAGGPPALCYVTATAGGMSNNLHCSPNQTGAFPGTTLVLSPPQNAPVFAATDADGDGKTDFLFLQTAGGPENAVGVGRGDGTGGASRPASASSLRYDAANARWPLLNEAHFTGSGHADLFAVDAANQVLLVATGNGAGAFTPTAKLTLPDGGATAVLAADVTGDGQTDLLMLGTAQRVVSTFTGKGDGTFVAGPSYALPAGIASILLADMDGDGRKDLLVEVMGGGLSYFPALQAGGFAAVAIPVDGAQDASSGRGGHLVAVADRNGDGIPDIVTATPLGISVLLGQSLNSGIPRVVSVKLLGIFDPGLGDATAGRRIFAQADFNGDGVGDLAVDNPQGILLLFGRTDGSFAAPRAVTGGLSANPEPSEYGAGFTLTATLQVPASGSDATGTVDFVVDGNPVGSATVLNNSAALSIVAPGYIRGSHTVSATYSGDGSYMPATFTATHVITGLRSQTTFTLSTPTIFYGQVADGRGSVAAIDNANSATINGGTITFYDGATVICVLPVNGMAGTCPATAGSGFPVGQHQLTAMYSGNDFYAPSTSDAATVQVLPDDTTGTVTSSQNPSTPGQPVTLTAVFTAAFATPAGMVTFYDGAAALGSTVLNAAGLAAFTTSTLALGTHNITAVLAPSLNFNGSTTGALAQMVLTPALPASTTLLTSSANPSYVGQTVTFTAAVTTGAGAASAAAAGSVVFAIDGVLSNSVMLDAQGRASLTLSTLTQGTHTVTASFAATSLLAASVSPTLTQQVNAAGAGGFLLTVNPSSLQVPIGSSVSVLVTVTPLNGFAQAVSLSCSGLPSEAGCTFANATIPAGGGSTRLTLAAAAPHSCNSNEPYFVASGPATILDALIPTAMMFLLRRRRRLFHGLTMLFALAVLPAISGCSGNCTDLGVRPATYSFTVTGTSAGTPAVTISQNARFTAHL